VTKALRLEEGDFLEPDSKSKTEQSELLWSVAKTAAGLHGTPLGFGHFIRNLPEATLQAACGDSTLFVLIIAHAMLIVDGDPDLGIEMNRLEDRAAHHTMRMLLNIEHFRRIGLLRAKYPHDPFNEVPEIAWWKGHPYVKVLYSLPAEHQEKLTDLLLLTGDLRVLGGHIAILSKAEQQRFLEQTEAIDSNLPEYLKYLEDEYGDSQQLAWADPMRREP
jgi:hypothetical protein